MSLPTTMRAVLIERSGGPEVLRTVSDRPVPRPGVGEVLIRVAAAGVNRADVMQREGRYPMPPGAPADVTIIDPKAEWTIDVNQFKSKSRNSPFHGWKVRGRAKWVIVEGGVIAG